MSLIRRVIALDKAPDRTAVREVMTPDPTMVTMDESAMDALGLMLDNKTRHLPVSSYPTLHTVLDAPAPSLSVVVGGLLCFRSSKQALIRHSQT